MDSGHMDSRKEAAPKLAILLPHASSRIPPYWLRMLEELDELDVHTEVIDAVVRPLIREAEPPPERRAYLPSVAFVRGLLRSPARIFLCVEYGLATLVDALAARLRCSRELIFQEHSGRAGMRQP